MADNTTLVTFNQDIFPYCFGDVVALTDEQLKAVDAEAKQRDLTNPYTKGAQVADSDTIVTPTVDSDAELTAEREATSADAESKAAPADDKPSKKGKASPSK